MNNIDWKSVLNALGLAGIAFGLAIYYPYLPVPTLIAGSAILFCCWGKQIQNLAGKVVSRSKVFLGAVLIAMAVQAILQLVFDVDLYSLYALYQKFGYEGILSRDGVFAAILLKQIVALISIVLIISLWWSSTDTNTNRWLKKLGLGICILCLAVQAVWAGFDFNDRKNFLDTSQITRKEAIKLASACFHNIEKRMRALNLKLFKAEEITITGSDTIMFDGEIEKIETKIRVEISNDQPAEPGSVWLVYEDQTGFTGDFLLVKAYNKQDRTIVKWMYWDVYQEVLARQERKKPVEPEAPAVATVIPALAPIKSVLLSEEDVREDVVAVNGEEWTACDIVAHKGDIVEVRSASGNLLSYNELDMILVRCGQGGIGYFLPNFSASDPSEADQEWCYGLTEITGKNDSPLRFKLSQPNQLSIKVVKRG